MVAIPQYDLDKNRVRWSQTSIRFGISGIECGTNKHSHTRSILAVDQCNRDRGTKLLKIHHKQVISLISGYSSVQDESHPLKDYSSYKLIGQDKRIALKPAQKGNSQNEGMKNLVQFERRIRVSTYTGIELISLHTSRLLFPDFGAP